jgi:hypothetical protein
VTSDADDRLLAPYRQVRRLAQGDAPWPGMLVRLAAGGSLMLVDAQEFGAEWAGWRSPVDGHVLAPLDVVRQSDGHSIALPVCTERLADFLTRRDAARVPLSLGEIVTIGVSLLRGMAELDSTSCVTGEWWLTDAGRPTLATDITECEAPAHTADLLRALTSGARHDAVLTDAAESVGAARRSTHDLRMAEERLFSLAAPEPLATSLLAPRPARDLYAFDREPGGADVDQPAPSWVDAIARHVDTDLADAVSRATTGMWRRLRTTRARPRKPWMLAGGAAAAVLVAGLLWPTGAGGPATAEVAGTTRSAAPTPTVTADPATAHAGDSTTPADLVEVTNTLLAARSACGDDSGCLSSVVLDPSTAFDHGPIDLDAQRRTTTLLDDFGGVAVLRVDALDQSQPSQLVVVMLDGDRWLLRDVHAAKQP